MDDPFADLNTRRVMRLEDALGCIRRCSCARDRRETTPDERKDMMSCSDYRMSIVLWYSAIEGDAIKDRPQAEIELCERLTALRQMVVHVKLNTVEREETGESEGAAKIHAKARELGFFDDDDLDGRRKAIARFKWTSRFHTFDTRAKTTVRVDDAVPPASVEQQVMRDLDRLRAQTSALP